MFTWSASINAIFIELRILIMLVYPLLSVFLLSIFFFTCCWTEHKVLFSFPSFFLLLSFFFPSPALNLLFSYSSPSLPFCISSPTPLLPFSLPYSSLYSLSAQHPSLIIIIRLRTKVPSVSTLSPSIFSLFSSLLTYFIHAVQYWILVESSRRWGRLSGGVVKLYYRQWQQCVVNCNLKCA